MAGNFMNKYQKKINMEKEKLASKQITKKLETENAEQNEEEIVLEYRSTEDGLLPESEKYEYCLDNLYWFCGVKNNEIVVIPVICNKKYDKVKNLKTGKIYDFYKTLGYLNLNNGITIWQIISLLRNDYTNLENRYVFDSDDIYKTPWFKKRKKILLKNQVDFEKWENVVKERFEKYLKEKEIESLSGREF